jgi:hypothetical protein
VRKVLVVTATTAVGMALMSCSEPAAVYSPASSRVVYEPSARIERAPLPLPGGYASAAGNGPSRLSSYGGSPHEGGSEPNATTPGDWRSSPRWAAIEGQGCIVVEQDAHTKFAPAEAAKVKAGNCSKKDREADQFRSNANQPALNSHGPELPAGSDKPAPSNPYTSPPIPPSENRSDGAIGPWTGAI